MADQGVIKMMGRKELITDRYVLLLEDGPHYRYTDRRQAELAAESETREGRRCAIAVVDWESE